LTYIKEEIGKKFQNTFKQKSATQVVSHVQKYFLHQSKILEQKKRKNIHDIVLKPTDAVQVQERILINVANQGFSNNIHTAHFNNIQSIHQNDELFQILSSFWT